MKTILAIALLGLAAGLLPALSGCANSSSNAGEYYYPTGSIHRDAYPRA